MTTSYNATLEASQAKAGYLAYVQSNATALTSDPKIRIWDTRVDTWDKWPVSHLCPTTHVKST